MAATEFAQGSEGAIQRWGGKKMAKTEPLIVKPITEDEFDSNTPIDTSKRRGVIGGTITTHTFPMVMRKKKKLVEDKQFPMASYMKKGVIGGGVGGDVDEDDTHRWTEK